MKRINRYNRFFQLVTLFGWLLLGSAMPGMATTWTVTSLADDGSAGTLRSEVNVAVAGDTINFGVTGTITLTQGQIEIGKNLTISGPGARSLAISGNNATRILQVDAGAALYISGVTIENANIVGGCCAGGGAIYNAGSLTLSDSAVSNNSAGYAGYGGGIYNEYPSQLTLIRTTLSGNSAENYGGAIWNGGNTIATNSTFSGNSAHVGGVAWNVNGMTVINSTVSGNSAATNVPGFFGGPLYLKNTILAKNIGNTGSANCHGAESSLGYNLSDDDSCSPFLTQPSDINNTPAGLDPNGLQNNGGQTQTIALVSGSPAIDAIPVSPTNYCTDVAGNPVTTDQRGIARPQGPACDIGAFELVAGPVYAAQIQQPVNTDGSSVFSATRGVVPVKFTLTADGTATCNLPPATISLTRTAGGTVGPIDESVYQMSADTGSYFRIDSTACQYVYNLASKSLGVGTYVVKININNSAVGSATFGLK